MTAGTSSPLVTIGVPVYNGEQFLERALDSLLAQDYRELEVIISDNGSTDSTEQIARRYAARDPRVRYVRSEVNRGAAWNFNNTLDLANGTYFKWAAYDDECDARLVSSCVAALEQRPEAVLAYAKTAILDSDSIVVGALDEDLDLPEPTPHERVRRILRNRVEWHPIFGVMRTAILRQTRRMGAYVEADAVVLMELAMRGRFVEIPDRLFHRRIHPRTSVHANPDPTSRAAWFDPKNAGRLVLPRTRLALEFVRSILLCPVDNDERARCLWSVLRDWVIPWRRAIVREVPEALVARARRARRARPVRRADAGLSSR